MSGKDDITVLKAKTRGPYQTAVSQTNQSQILSWVAVIKRDDYQR